MFKPELMFVWLSILTFGPGVRFSRSEIGTASYYISPYTPTACFDSDPRQFPANSYFAAAGEGIWDNGAACGRQYLVECIVADLPQACVANKSINVRIVDRASNSVSRPVRDGHILVLSNVAYAAIANIAAPFLSVQYKQLT